MAERFLAALAAHGVDFFFANPGTDFPPVVEAFARAQAGGAPMPRPLVVPHENLAVAMAHGATLMTGRTQAVMVHVNVGTANTINILANLARDNVPLLLCAGRTPITEGGHFGSRNRQIHWAQEMFDQAGMVRELVKWDYEFRAPGLVDAAVARALEIAQTSPQGPVYLVLPREPLSAPAGEAPIVAPRRIATPPHPDPRAVCDLNARIAAARRPVILAGGLGRSATAIACLAGLAEALAVPVVQVWPREMCLPSGHPMHFGYDAAPLLRDADLVLALECDVPWSTAQEAPPENAFLVQIGADAAFQRYPMRTFRADLAITATAESVLEAVHNAAAVIAGRCGDALEARRTWLAAQAAERRARLEAAAQPACDHITPAHLTRAISQIAGPEAIVFNEYPLLLDHLERSKPGTFFGLSPAGGLGWGLGAAIGAKLAAPDKFVIAAVGDGAYMFANPTACHWMQQAANAPVLTVVVNNSRYGAVRRATLSMFRDGVAGRDDGMGLADLGPSPPFHAFVAAQGGFGEIVERPQQLAGAMARAKRAVVEEGRQALLNVVCPC